MKTSQELFTLNRIVLRALIHPFSFQNDKFLLLIQENIYGVIILNQNLYISSIYVSYYHISYKNNKSLLSIRHKLLKVLLVGHKWYLFHPKAGIVQYKYDIIRLIFYRQCRGY